MAPQQKPAGGTLISNLWGNWVNLDPAQRAAVASQLGAVGNLLSIAANVHRFANPPAQGENGSPPPSAQTSRPGATPRDDDDVIDAEFEEVKK